MRATRIVIGLLPMAALALLATASGAQVQSSAANSAAPDVPQSAAQTTAQSAPAPVQVSVAARPVVLPAGTKVLLAMKSAVNTKSARVGDGVYLVSTFHVVLGDRVVIPPGVYVQGVIDDVQRHVKLKGKTQFHMHFTSMIFPNGSVVVIPGVVNSIPGSDSNQVKDEGVIEHNSTVGKDLGTIASTTVPGAGVGALGGLATGRPGTGILAGAGGGLVIGTAMVLFGHNDVSLEAGVPVEMVLQRPLELMQTQTATAGPNGQATAYTPSPDQKQPMKKSSGPGVFCPSGLGCD